MIFFLFFRANKYNNIKTIKIIRKYVTDWMCNAASLNANTPNQILKIIELINNVTNNTAPKKGLWLFTLVKRK